MTMHYLAFTLILVTNISWGASNPWEKFDSPADQPAAPVGSYANGCLLGAEALPARGVGYQGVRLKRMRNFGHPQLIEFIEDLGHSVKRNRLGLMLVADIAMPRGGPFSSGHRSHQTGLDVDIWLPLNYVNIDSNNASLESVSMVNQKEFVINPDVWTDKQAQMIRLAAEDSRVARIFVHPAIKRTLCETNWNNRTWLQKIRPWWGHDSHFHVRLHCPADAVECIAQTAPATGDGCGDELASWYPENQPDKPVIKKPRPTPLLPATCQSLLTQSNPSKAVGQGK